MSYYVLLSHTKEIFFLTMPIFIVLVVISMAAAGVIHQSDSGNYYPDNQEISNENNNNTENIEVSVSPSLKPKTESRIEKQNSSSVSAEVTNAIESSPILTPESPTPTETPSLTETTMTPTPTTIQLVDTQAPTSIPLDNR